MHRLYFSHSYDLEDLRFNERLWKLLMKEGFHAWIDSGRRVLPLTLPPSAIAIAWLHFARARWLSNARRARFSARRDRSRMRGAASRQSAAHLHFSARSVLSTGRAAKKELLAPTTPPPPG
jgi:hypothetical protein